MSWLLASRAKSLIHIIPFKSIAMNPYSDLPFNYCSVQSFLQAQTGTHAKGLESWVFGYMLELGSSD